MDALLEHSRFPGGKSVMNPITQFACKNTLLQRLPLLDQELNVFGYPSILHQDHTLNDVMIVNAVHDLIQVHRKTLQSHSNVSDLCRTSDSEVIRLQHLISNLKEDLANKDTEIKSKTLESAQLKHRTDTLQKKLKVEVEKTRKLSTDLTGRDVQYKHEKKKYMQEIDRLQSKLQQILQDKRMERLQSIDILNSLQRSDGSRGKWSTDKTKKNTESDMYKLIITNYEDTQKQLIEENGDMRKFLKQMQDELMTALNENCDEKEHHGMNKKIRLDFTSYKTSRIIDGASNCSDASLPLETTSTDMFKMPYHIVKEDIERCLTSQWQALRRGMGYNLPQRSSSDASAHFDQTRTIELERVISEQQEVIEYLTSDSGGEGKGAPTDVYFLEEKAELERQRAYFQMQQDKFEREREEHMEAADCLQRDRISFEQEKCKWLKNQFMQLTPFRTNPSGKEETKKSPPNTGISKFTSRTTESCTEVRGQVEGSSSSSSFKSSEASSPEKQWRKSSNSSVVKTPSGRGLKSKLPSTDELYRELGLSCGTTAPATAAAGTNKPKNGSCLASGEFYLNPSNRSKAATHDFIPDDDVSSSLPTSLLSTFSALSTAPGSVLHKSPVAWQDSCKLPL